MLNLLFIWQREVIHELHMLYDKHMHTGYSYKLFDVIMIRQTLDKIKFAQERKEFSLVFQHMKISTDIYHLSFLSSEVIIYKLFRVQLELLLFSLHVNWIQI